MTDTNILHAQPITLPSAKASRAKRAARKTRETATNTAAADSRNAKTPTKLDLVIELLARPEGASLDELCATTGWQVHSVRGAMAGALKRKGHIITSDKHEGVRRYHTGTV